MGVDDALAIALALASPELSLVGLTTVGGNVPLAQATLNVGRLLRALRVASFPPIGQGLDQPGGLEDARHVHGDDGMGNVSWPPAENLRPTDFLSVYEQAIAAHGRGLSIVAIGPLTNLAAVLRARPGLLEQVGHIVVMGGTFRARGNITPHAEFNFYRDPAAAAAVLGAGLPVRMVPLDVTSTVVFDEAHAAQLSVSRHAGARAMAEMLADPMSRPADGGVNRFMVHDATALGTLIWGQLFTFVRTAFAVTLSGPQAGQSRPVRQAGKEISCVISVQAPEFTEKLLERLAASTFVV
jgi:inosine-uridine nucleoside N-ribohydrolase